MKYILTLLLASASLSYGAANDLLIAQRNSTDTGQLTRLVAHPGGSNNGLVAFNGATLLPVCIQIGDGLVWSTGQLSALATQGVLDAKQDLISAATTSDYYRGDKTWQTLNKGSVGLSNVDNTSDASKPVSTATQTALNAKADTSSLSTVALSGSYLDLSNKPSIPAGQVNSDWSSGSGLSQILNKPTLGTAAAQNSTAFATATQGVKADSALQPGWTGQNTITTVGTISVGTWQGAAIANTYIASAATWNAKEPAISTGLNTQFWRGDKTWAVPPTTPSYSTSTVSRSLNSSFVPSSTRPAFVTYSVEISASLTLTGGQTGTVYLETSPDNSAWTEVARISNGNTGTLAVGIAITQAMTGTLTGFIPTNYYARLRTQNNTGSPTITYRSGAETLS